MEKTAYYVYELIDPRNGKPFYIGKGIVWKYDNEACVWMYFDEDADEWLLYDENNFDPFTKSLFQQHDSTLPSTASNQHEPEQQQASNVISLPQQRLL